MLDWMTVFVMTISIACTGILLLIFGGLLLVSFHNYPVFTAIGVVYVGGCSVISYHIVKKLSEK